MSEEELVLESIGSWSSELLKQQLRSGKISRHVDRAEVAASCCILNLCHQDPLSIHRSALAVRFMCVGCLFFFQVEHVLKFPFHSNLDRLEHRWHIEHFKKQGFQMLKSAYR